ncbi:MAG: hypothetical protein ACTSQB_06205, partial [Candidatus Heimdallarchaeota archaeon]
GTFMHILIPKEKRGQLLGLLFFAKILAQIPGVLIGGLFAHFFKNGYQYGFIIGAAFLLFSIPFLLRSNLPRKTEGPIKQTKHSLS